MPNQWDKIGCVQIILVSPRLFPEISLALGFLTADDCKPRARIKFRRCSPDSGFPRRFKVSAPLPRNNPMQNSHFHRRFIGIRCGLLCARDLGAMLTDSQQRWMKSCAKKDVGEVFRKQNWPYYRSFIGTLEHGRSHPEGARTIRFKKQ